MSRSLVHFVQLTRDQLDEAKALISCVELQTVRFSQFKLASDAQPQPEGNVELSSSNRSSSSIAQGEYRIKFDLALQGHQANVLIIDISARIEATYSVPINQAFSDAQMKQFARSNGMLNVWPYWREYVQAAIQRAGLAPFTLPLFRVLHKQSKAK